MFNQDYHLWLKETAELLHNQNFGAIDLPRLIEEIEDMSKSQRSAVRSNLRIVLMHLLKYKYQPEKRTNSWLSSITEHRTRLELDLQDSPSLQPFLVDIFADTYARARRLAADETGLTIDNFPKECPFSLAAALDIDYLPN